jgi:hypothetical protein
MQGVALGVTRKIKASKYGIVSFAHVWHLNGKPLWEGGGYSDMMSRLWLVLLPSCDYVICAVHVAERERGRLVFSPSKSRDALFNIRVVAYIL